MNQALYDFLKPYGADAFVAHECFRFIRTLFPQLNEQSLVRYLDINAPTMREMRMYYDTPTFDQVELKVHRIGFSDVDREYQLRATYSPQHDTLYVDRHVATYDHYYKYKSRGEFVQLPCCPRCGSIDFKRHGAGLPKWLRVKNAVTCKQCNHTVHTREFKPA